MCKTKPGTQIDTAQASHAVGLEFESWPSESNDKIDTCWYPVWRSAVLGCGKELFTQYQGNATE